MICSWPLSLQDGSDSLVIRTYTWMPRCVDTQRHANAMHICLGSYRHIQICPDAYRPRCMQMHMYTAGCIQSRLLASRILALLRKMKAYGLRRGRTSPLSVYAVVRTSRVLWGCAVGKGTATPETME
ncbi:hypothetical protein KIL84_004497 [Mauremys mutica]|uniref:Uncharacterized protein n=1 Tax=Mauremys mutica TaxID=74926 RepID=A0A9D3XPT7_9SAUR|nr:hypothetical protein KIL84_004497 [Mauremys mutica]